MARPASGAGRAGVQVTAPIEPSVGVTFINARMDGRIGSLRIAGSRIAALHQGPRPGDRIVDLQGDRLLPGLINAHDHLQLNNLPALGFMKRYRNVREWIVDINSRRRTDAGFESHVAVARDARLGVGGLKNLLSGVTTVAHHDPLYPYLRDLDYPVAVVADYGWSHSLYVDAASDVRASYQATPIDWPWIIHLGEGVDEEAREEFERLDALGCIGANTVLVHGVALDRAQRQRLHDAHGALIWCPSSNIGLFGKTVDVEHLAQCGRVALGTDSRLSGSVDLLEELRVAGDLGGFDEATLESLVTRESAQVLRLSDRGALRIGARADLVILPAGARLSRAERADVRLVVLNGDARYGDGDYARAVSPATSWTPIRVDGKSKMLARHVAMRLCGLNVTERGVELPDLRWEAA
jgi:cytosine/adenosine deaminase-related metal-dependent hydrolase